MSFITPVTRRVLFQSFKVMILPTTSVLPKNLRAVVSDKMMVFGSSNAVLGLPAMKGRVNTEKKLESTNASFSSL
ncbi:hypothetical protein D3C87_1927640 [compost metagenome]